MILFAQSEPVEPHEYFQWIDWTVVFGYLLLTTWVGHALRGKQATIKDFFLGGRSLPWPAVSGSIVATAISGVTFIGVPGMVYALTGNFTYLQWSIGAIIARIFVGYVFVKAFYEEEIYSPYDYMGRKLGIGAKRLATIIFSVGSILGQSVRVLVAALALDVVTPWSFESCIIAIGVFAVAWTLMGGMQTVIWTDVMQFLLFIVGGLVALFWIIGGLDVSIIDVGREWDKFSILDLTTDPKIGFTLWVAILAAPFQNLSAYGVDQLNAQRMFCCRSQEDAKKAILWSSIGELITLLMLMVGAALFVWYHQKGLTPLEADSFEKTGYVFPTWITTTLPVGLRGLILAGIFAAAISSLDSILAALSQTTLSLFVNPEQHTEESNSKKLLVWSRILVVTWGIFLSYFAILLDQLRGNVNVVDLAFGMIAYTSGPMLGIFIAALKFPRASVTGLTVGVAVSFIMVASIRTDVFKIAENFDWATTEEIAEAVPTINATSSKVPFIDASDEDSLRKARGTTAVVHVTIKEQMPIQANYARKGFLYKLTDSPLRVYLIPAKDADGKEKEMNVTKLVGGEFELSGKVFIDTEGFPAMVFRSPDSFKEQKPKEMDGEGEDAKEVRIGPPSLSVIMSFAWMWPVTFFVTLGFGLLFPRRQDPDASEV